MFRRLAPTTAGLWLLLLIRPARATDRSAGVKVDPENVRIGMLYDGQNVRVTAWTPAPRDVVVRITGPEQRLVLKKKGKKFGVLWMNVGEVCYPAVPSLYLLSSSRKLEEIADPATLNRLKLGFDALKNQLPAASDDGARELFPEMVKLKQKDGLFSSQEGVKLDTAEPGRQEATAELFLPAKTPVDEYTVDVFAFHDRQGELIGTAKIHLEQGGSVSMIDSLADNHGLIYGLLAVVVAILAGLLTGFIFGR